MFGEALSLHVPHDLVAVALLAIRAEENNRWGTKDPESVEEFLNAVPDERKRPPDVGGDRVCRGVQKAARFR